MKDSDQLIQRLNIMLDGESDSSFCRRAGFKRSTLESIRKRQNPTLEALIAVCQAGNVNLAWLATGEGPMVPGEKSDAPQASARTIVDPELFRWIIDGLAKLYKEIGIRMPPHEMGYKAAELHNEIIQEFSDLDQQRSALKLLLRAYRSELIGHPIEAGKAKQESG